MPAPLIVCSTDALEGQTLYDFGWDDAFLPNPLNSLIVYGWGMCQRQWEHHQLSAATRN